MAENKQLNWEDVSHDNGFCLRRAAVFGGWLVITVDDVISPDGEVHRIGSEFRTSITFVPDPKHEWSLKAAYPHIRRTFL